MEGESRQQKLQMQLIVTLDLLMNLKTRFRVLLGPDLDLDGLGFVLKMEG